MNSKVYEICGIVGAVLCLILCLLFVPEIGALKFLGIVVLSGCAGILAFDLSYVALFKLLQSTNPSDWQFAVMERMYADGTKKYQPVIKTVKFGYYTNIDKTFLSSVSNETEFDTYEEAEEVIKGFKEFEIEQYKQKVQELKENKCKKVNKPKIVNVTYTQV